MSERLAMLWVLPIINQPQVAILATGAIRKPAVIETTYGDVIAIRHMMFFTSTYYDHRVVDGLERIFP